MEVKVVPLGHIQTNCYILLSPKTAIVIDPGFNSSVTEQFLKDNKDKETLILLTHAHFDHIGGALSLRNSTGTPIAIGEWESENLKDPSVNLSQRFHAVLESFDADILAKDGQELQLGDLKFKVIFTPGHTTGGVSYLFDDKLFSGDTLFFESIGRTDFPGGDFGVLKNSIKKLYALPDEIVVFPGHGESSTIGHEKKYNPFVR